MFNHPSRFLHPTPFVTPTLCAMPFKAENAWDFFFRVYLDEFSAKDRKAKTFQEFSGFFSRNFEEKARNVQSTRE